MKTKTSKLVVILFSIIFTLIMCNNVYANSIVSVSSQTVNLNSDFYLILNLSSISYTKFKVEITNTSSLKSSNLSEGISELSNDDGSTSFVVDKNSIGLDKIGVVYTSSSQSSKINFEVKITSLDDNTSSIQTQISTLTDELNTLSTNLTSLKDSLSSAEEGSEEYTEISTQISELEVTITSKNTEIENLQNQVSSITEESVTETISVDIADTTTSSSNSKNESAWGDMDQIMKDKEGMEDMEGMFDDEKMSASMKEMMSKMSSLESDLETANNTISSLTTTTTYQGSQNNYLKSLSITGVEFKNEFKKTTSDYFATVDSSVTSVTVNATAEDSSSIVTIYGNTNLQEGKNKIIISVTSEDGSVRNYKIYVTK